METLETLTRRVKTVGEMQSLVHTIRTLSAVNIRQYENAAAALSAFVQTTELGIGAMKDWLKPRLVSEEPGSRNTALIVIGAERGLCGRYSEIVAREASSRQQSAMAQAKKPMPLLALGSRLSTILARDNTPVSRTLILPSSAHGLGAVSGRVVRILDGWRSEEAVHSVEVMYMGRQSSGRLELRQKAVWPIDNQRLTEIFDRPWQSRRLPLWQGAPEKIVLELMRELLISDLTGVCLEAMIAESTARLSAPSPPPGRRHSRIDGNCFRLRADGRNAVSG